MVTYQFVYDPESPYRELYYLYFHPTEAPSNTLPYLTERGNPEKANEIFISNVKFAATELLGEDMANSFMSSKVRYFSGETTLIISNFSAGYECDAPTFTADFVREVRSIKIATMTLAVEHSDC
ncbi:hypothetical protein [Gynuella sp.]|uniref:hypothetical protein n=1 Tax=Gynuella sp. TaxID=2969146 RepID=UPI003D119215